VQAIAKNRDAPPEGQPASGTLNAGPGKSSKKAFDYRPMSRILQMAEGDQVFLS
jgi:hypothetical protein